MTISTFAVPSWATLGIAAVASAVARWALGLMVPAEWALLVVNCVGCALVGWSSALARRHGKRFGPWFNVGLCGSLTSMSALALLVADELSDGNVAVAGGWLAANVIGCVWAYLLAASWPPATAFGLTARAVNTAVATGEANDPAADGESDQLAGGHTEEQSS